MEEKLSMLNESDTLSNSQKELLALHNITYSEIIELKKFFRWSFSISNSTWCKRC